MEESTADQIRDIALLLADEGNLHVKYWRIASDFPKGTALWLFIHNEQFVKIRMTWDRDPTIDEIGYEFVSAVYEALD